MKNSQKKRFIRLPRENLLEVAIAEKKIENLHKLCWKYVSEIVRRKAIVENDMAVCYTCGSIKYWNELQCGHFIHGGSHKRSLLDFEPDNLRAQCVRCNHFLSGNMSSFRRKLEEEIGIMHVARLEVVKNYKNEMTVEDYERKLKDLKRQLKAML